MPDCSLFGRWLLGRCILVCALWLTCEGLLSGCSRCSSEVIGELSQKKGEVVRDYANALQQWETAPLGTQFELGDAVRTASQAIGEVTFDDGARLLIEPSTTIRFLRSAAREPGIAIEAGQAVIETGTGVLRLQTEFGLAILQPGTKVELSRGERGLRVLVSVGLARLEGAAGSFELGAGRGVEVGIGMAIIEEFAKHPEPSAEAAKPADPEPAAAAGTVQTSPEADESPIIADSKVVQERPPGFYDVSVSAGGSLLVHDPAPPTAVRLAFAGKCPERGVVERLSGGKPVAASAGVGSVNMRFSPGSSAYRLRCISNEGQFGPVAAKGQITVYRDAGTAALPRKAPATTVNTDGRAYTVLYQNLLPAITVRWPDAPPAPSYTLSFESTAQKKTRTQPSAEFVFAPGDLREGAYSFQIQSANGRSSRPARATIQFDNAAPKAVIKSPGNGEFAANQTVEVAGISLPGWQVSAQGVELPLDTQQRFSGSVAANPRGLVLEFTHAQRGTHHYLRRVAGAER